MAYELLLGYSMTRGFGIVLTVGSNLHFLCGGFLTALSLHGPIEYR